MAHLPYCWHVSMAILTSEVRKHAMKTFVNKNNIFRFNENHL